MDHIRFVPGLLLIGALAASSAVAQVQRTFVSGLGSDGNPCSRTAPCRTFTQAISQTNAGGEVYVLDTAGYGPVTITKSVSIVAPQGVVAGITVFSGDGIDIDAGASDTIVLRGLTINNQGSSGGGIVFNTGGTLYVESCVVGGFPTTNAVAFFGPGRLRVKDCIMRGNGGGLLIRSTSGTAVATIEHVQIEGDSNSGTGVEVGEGAQVTVRDSVASRTGVGFVAVAHGSTPAQLTLERCLSSDCSFAGIWAINSSPALADITVESCVVSGNATGIQATSNFPAAVATVRVSNSTITNNPTGLLNSGSPAVLLSRGNNTVEGNGASTSGLIGSYTAK